MPDPESSTELHMAEWWLCRSCNRRLLWRLAWVGEGGDKFLARPDSLACSCGKVYRGDEVSSNDTCPGAAYDCPHCGRANDILPPTEDDMKSFDVEVENEDGEGATVHVTQRTNEYEILADQTCRHCGQEVYVVPGWYQEKDDDDDDE